MKVSTATLHQGVREALVTIGAPENEAAIGAEMCVDAELRGHSSHGVRLLRNIAAAYERGADRRRAMRVVDESPVSARLDGGFHLSWFVHWSAIELVIEKAAAMGIAVVSVGNAGGSGALGYLVEKIAAAGLVGLAANSTPLTVVAPGSSVPSLGTNPLAIGLPRRSGTPLVLDMATSSIAFNEILRLRETGRALPEGVAVDADGSMTTDPNGAIDPDSGRSRILPFGGHRGYGLTLMLELMVSAGVTGRTGQDKRGAVLTEPADFSALYFAYRPGLVGDREQALDATDQLLTELTATGARIPGESSRLRREQCLRDGEVDVAPEGLDVLSSIIGRGINEQVGHVADSTDPRASGRPE
jgi:LDH2 family malate/lactate/ureidoglycolate dehydrogenase